MPLSVVALDLSAHCHPPVAECVIIFPRPQPRNRQWSLLVAFSSLLFLPEVWSGMRFASVEGNLFSESGDLSLGLREERHRRKGGSGGTLGCGLRAELVCWRSISPASLQDTGQTVPLERASEATHSVGGIISVPSRSFATHSTNSC